MSFSWLVTNSVSALLLPPLNLIVPAAIGFMLRSRWPRVGALLCLGSLAALVIFSTPAGARLLIAPLERLAPPLVSPATSGAQAIVVLGGGRIPDAPEYDGRDMPSLEALGRVRYGARLHRATGLPLMVTGGMPDGATEPEAELMARALREDFAVAVKWVESEANNTAQNAQFSARILKQAGVRHILLVTDAVHMPRAQIIFERQGLQVVPAPTTFMARGSLAFMDFVPSGRGLARSHYGLHEWIGLAWYQLRYRNAR